MYTNTAVHAAAAAALTIFGLLVFVDPIFVVLAIASYLVPPVLLYVLSDEPGLEETGELEAETDETREPETSEPTRLTGSRASEPKTRRSSVDNGSGTADVDAGETVFDGDATADGDTDPNSADSDSDSDSADSDSDSDSDDGDTDSDSDDGDTDSDSDDGDSDRNG